MKRFPVMRSARPHIAAILSILSILSLILVPASCKLMDLVNQKISPEDGPSPEEEWPDISTITRWVDSLNKPNPLYDSLPAPLPVIGCANAEDSAKTLAGIINFGGPMVLPAMVTAVRAAGFGIRHAASGRIMYEPTNPSNGMAFKDWELICISRLVGNRQLTPFTDIAALLSFDELEIDSATLLGHMSTDLLLSTMDSCSSNRFWAHLINALGSERVDQDFDLHDGFGSYDEIMIDHFQLALISMRLGGDLLAAAKAVPANERPAAQPKRAAPPCNFDDAQGNIMDGAAQGTTTAFDQVMNYLEDKGLKGIDTYKKFTGAATGVLSIVKYIAATVCFEVNVELDQVPLVRTMSASEDGETRKVIASAKMNTGKLTTLNCFRIMLNAAGLDFNLPSDGPVSDAQVKWEFRLPPSDAVYYNLPKQYTSFASVKTDKDGKAYLDAVGFHQQNTMRPPLQKVNKTGYIGARISINSTTIFNTILGALGNVLDGGAAAVTIPLDVLSRIPVYGKAITYPIIDWEDVPEPDPDGPNYPY